MDMSYMIQRQGTHRSRLPVLLRFLYRPHIDAVNFELLDRLALHVGLCVKVTEQQDERDHVADQCVMHPERKLASRNDSIDAEHHGHGELNQLKDCQVFLPPEVFVHVRSYRSQTVVRIH